MKNRVTFFLLVSGGVLTTCINMNIDKIMEYSVHPIALTPLELYKSNEKKNR